MENNNDFKNIRGTDYKNINGWGVDADPKNDPTYPIKKRNNGEHAGYTWERPPLQPETVEVLKSIERPNVTATFGTTVPPTGLSGMLRRYAFTFSESSYGHWLPLLLADRVNVVEGVIDDLAHGHIPNIFAEKGWKAEWQHNRKGLITKVVVTAVVTTALIALFSGKDKKHKKLHKRSLF